MANPIYQALPTTIFTVMSGLARELGAINLGQGFPDEPGPRAIREKAAQALLDGDNQYPPMPGLPELRQAVADSLPPYRQKHVELNVKALEAGFGAAPENVAPAWASVAA